MSSKEIIIPQEVGIYVYPGKMVQKLGGIEISKVFKPTSIISINQDTNEFSW